MTSPLIDGYVAGLHRRLPPAIAEEAAGGLTETYEHHLAAGTAEREAAHAALAEFGDLAMVAGEFTRQAPGRRAARLLLATGPVAGSAWAAALIAGRAWIWPVPAGARLGFGAVLLLTVLALLAAATSRHSYRRTRLAAAASPVVLALDATAIAAALAAAPVPTVALGIAVAVSLGRIASPPGRCPASPPTKAEATAGGAPASPWPAPRRGPVPAACRRAGQTRAPGPSGRTRQVRP
jgi:hypothetical protein